MALNPLMLLKLKDRLSIFQKDHPRVFPFFSMIKDQALEEGTVYELKVTTPDGKSYVTNIKLNENDLESIRMMLNEAK
ncbi:MAG: hypothetical protein J6P87_07745 [Lachnospiraceae bacterium]|nr:hypothetical protein [Lachnospiraceae bacterium]